MSWFADRRDVLTPSTLYSSK
ncbi:BnaC06g07350D [Brassica napus]|uniref:BnaC06g07350D protein n=1 Tax=Brassica napus TaxID=3708 RepID=A0A078IWJ2_BRANA|nr:BnaC06g07350D [Brassica napus]